MLNSLITSETRIKLLKKFFLNSNTVSHLRGLESEFGESSNAIRLELNRFEKAGLLTSSRNGNKKLYKANNTHPLYNDIHNIVLKETGVDKVVKKVILRLGNLQNAYLTGDFAHGKDNNIIELILVGKDIDSEYLAKKVEKAEAMIEREVKYIILRPDEANEYLKQLEPSDLLLLWNESELSEAEM
jgi:DNA-binding transcriptional ArsR family regulator